MQIVFHFDRSTKNCHRFSSTNPDVQGALYFSKQLMPDPPERITLDMADDQARKSKAE